MANLCWVDTWDERRRRLGPGSCIGRASPRGRGLRPWSPVAPSPWEGRSCILGTHPPTHTQSNLQDEQLLGKENGWLQIKLCINTFPTAVIAIFNYIVGWCTIYAMPRPLDFSQSQLPHICKAWSNIGYRLAILICGISHLTW